MILKAHAHEGEGHASSVESTTHYFEDPLIALPSALLFLVVLVLVLKKIGIKKHNITLVVLLFVFILAVAGLIFVPVVGLIAIITGFLMAFGTMLLGVGSKK